MLKQFISAECPGQTATVTAAAELRGDWRTGHLTSDHASFFFENKTL